MISSRTNAARRLRRFLAPASMSVLLHVFAVLQAAPALPGAPTESTPIDVYLAPVAPPDSETSASPAARSRSAVSVGTTPTRETSAPAASGQRRGVREGPGEPSSNPSFGTARDRHDRPPRPDRLEPVELEIMPAPPSSASVPEARASYEPLPDEPKPVVAPLYHTVPGAERPASMPPPAAPGVGVSFDFWSPPVFEEEMARATERIGRAEAEHQREKNTDLGHGVICNEGNGWFVCAHDDIARCNRDHDGNCRYAKPKERYQL